ncbi:uncharacterized protein LOC117119112 [Anneissia japonica]|uniref:uncharacterized protein LOC117119112 n=1 Tax=Anneissia japonica TaxID=1529436 RepID=UPI001425AA84|nr:uncharacterized protein LOC117119112 [Anneissia japonica]
MPYVCTWNFIRVKLLQLFISIIAIFVNLSQGSPNRCSSNGGGNNDTIQIQPVVRRTRTIIECNIIHAYNIIWYRFNETIQTSSIYKPPCNDSGNPQLRDEGQQLVIVYARSCHTAIYTCVANDSDVVTHSTDLRVVANPVHKPNLFNDSDSRTPRVALAEDVALTYLFDEGQGSKQEGVMFQWWIQTEHGLVFLSSDSSLLNFTTSSFYTSQKQWLVKRRGRL